MAGELVYYAANLCIDEMTICYEEIPCIIITDNFIPFLFVILRNPPTKEEEKKESLGWTGWITEYVNASHMITLWKVFNDVTQGLWTFYFEMAFECVWVNLISVSVNECRVHETIVVTNHFHIREKSVYFFHPLLRVLPPFVPVHRLLFSTFFHFTGLGDLPLRRLRGWWTLLRSDHLQETNYALWAGMSLYYNLATFNILL